MLTLSHSIKGLNEGFDSSSGLRVGISAGICRCGRDHGDAAPVTTVVGVGHPHLITLGPNRHNEQGCCVETHTIHTFGERRICGFSLTLPFIFPDYLTRPCDHSLKFELKKTVNN